MIDIIYDWWKALKGYLITRIRFYHVNAIPGKTLKNEISPQFMYHMRIFYENNLEHTSIRKIYFIIKFIFFHKYEHFEVLIEFLIQ